MMYTSLPIVNVLHAQIPIPSRTERYYTVPQIQQIYNTFVPSLFLGLEWTLNVQGGQRTQIIACGGLCLGSYSETIPTVALFFGA
jgi:hypothetical protein